MELEQLQKELVKAKEQKQGYIKDHYELGYVFNYQYNLKACNDKIKVIEGKIAELRLSAQTSLI